MTAVYRPVFIGDTEDGERIAIYTRNNNFHIKRGEGELCAISPGYEFTTYYDNLSSIMEVTIASKEWTGTAKGSKALTETAYDIRIS